MFGFITFGCKILFAAIIGGALNYIQGKVEDIHIIIETSLVCIFSAAVLALSRQLSENGQTFTMGFSILTVSVIVIAITKSHNFGNRIILIFSSVIGMIIGSGYFIQALLLGILVYSIIHNSENLLDFIYDQSDDVNDSGVKNISN